jgi:glycosyltransferase involved in cell wall biosynthesis
MPTISLLTVTQWNRRTFLPLLRDMIEAQTVKADEWIIVEGSRDPEEAEANGLLVRALHSTIPIRYITEAAGAPLGTLRQTANKEAKGDFRIVMDDDDYYPPTRVAHAVERLRTSGLRLAGCSRMLTYDFNRDTLYQFKSFGRNHSISPCMAWTSAYDGVYNPTATTAEEAGFTKGFTEPMVQLHPVHTIVHGVHGANTYRNKCQNPMAVELREAVQMYVPPAIVNQLKAAATN